jgi:hypothetical protein
VLQHDPVIAQIECERRQGPGGPLQRIDGRDL